MSLNIRGSTHDDGWNGQNVGGSSKKRESENRGHRDPDLRGLVSKLGRRGSTTNGTSGTRLPASSPASAPWWAPKNSPHSSSRSPSNPPARPPVTSPPRAIPALHRPEPFVGHGVKQQHQQAYLESWELPPSPAPSSLWAASSQQGHGRVASDAASGSSYHSNSGSLPDTGLAVDPSTSLIPAMSTAGIHAGYLPPSHILDPGPNPPLAAVEACMTWHELTLVTLAAERRRRGRSAFYANSRVAEVEAWNVRRLALWTDKRLEMVLRKVVGGP